MYNKTNIKYKNLIMEAYEKYPILRLFYGKNFIQIYQKIRNPKITIGALINSMALNKIKSNINFVYNEDKNNIENIYDYLDLLFQKSKCDLNQIYDYNKIINNLDLYPGLYKIEKNFSERELNTKLLNLYINLTGNPPIKNTLLICNEETTFEEIKAFFFRAIFCEYNSLFVISNLEGLQISITQEIIKILNTLYVNKNKKINSLFIILYEKEDSGLSRDIKKIIPDKYDFISTYLNNPKNKNILFDDIILYTSKFAGYGKTSEIKYQVKEKSGNYYYLPIGGTLSRNFVIKNLEKLKLDLKSGKNIYLHIDLSETENDKLMNEILMKLIILKYLDSKDKIYYLGTDVHLIIEIPKGFIDFKEKYPILELFNEIRINELHPLRLEENAEFIRDSPISIVAETLKLFESGKYATNINLDKPIMRNNVSEYDKIINKYFNVKNKNYYQKMNFIKILSVQFKKLHESIFLNLKINNAPQTRKIIEKARKTIIRNFIELSEVFTSSPYDSILNDQKIALINLGKYDEKEIKKNAIFSLAKNKKKEVFTFQQLKASLVFFNRDGQSLSIITNCEKNEKDYEYLKALWNSQKRHNNSNMEELVNYKDLTHDEFLGEIIKLFSLDNRTLKNMVITFLYQITILKWFEFY